MAWFRKRQEEPNPIVERMAARLLGLETELAEVQKQFRKLRDEVAEDLERAYRHRKAAEARDRAARKAGDAHGGVEPAEVSAPSPPSPPPGLRPVHLRRWLRDHAPAMNGAAE